MNIISSAPSWAQKSFTSMAAREPVEGTEQLPYTQERFEESVAPAVAGMMMLASLDEMEGMDQAMGQPGVVVQDDVTVTFEGQAGGAMEAVLLTEDPETGAEAAFYLDTTKGDMAALGLAKIDDAVVAEGAVVSAGAEGKNQGYLLAGQVA